MTFVTTDGNEGIEFSKEAEFKAGGIVLDDQAMVFGTDDDAQALSLYLAAGSLELSGAFVSVSGTTQFMHAVTIDGGSYQ